MYARFWDQGHTVIGVEFVRSALEEFFKEQSIKYTVLDLPDIEGSVFTVSSYEFL
jgi:hypothetical protein